MNVIPIRLHYFNNEIGHLLYVREDVLDDLLHVTFEKLLTVLTYEDKVTFQVVLVPVTASVGRWCQDLVTKNIASWPRCWSIRAIGVALV